MSTNATRKHRHTSERFRTSRHHSQGALHAHKMYFNYRLEKQGISSPGGLLYSTGHIIKARLCEQLNQCKLSVCIFVSKLDEAVQGNFILEVASYKA